jgi:Transposase, Mutator family
LAVVLEKRDRDSSKFGSGHFITFYNFPAEHWQHIRTTNPIESTFSTVKLRAAKTRGCISRAGMLAMVFKLTEDSGTEVADLEGAHAVGPSGPGSKVQRRTTRGSSQGRRLTSSYTSFDKNSF